MKLSLDCVSYAGYFYQGDVPSLEEVIKRAAKYGFDGVDLFPHRPREFPMDISTDRRKAIVDLAASLDIEIACVGAATNFMLSDHILAQRQDKELLFVRECCKLASDLHCKVVRIFAAWLGYFMPEHWDQGYSAPAMHSRSLDVSTEDDYLRQWEHIRQGIREAGRIASEYGVTLALQNHPPITNNVKDTIEMVEEVGLDSVKICLDLPLFEKQDDDSVRDTVVQVGDRMVHSHMIGIRFKESLAGRCGFEEVVPGEGRENWPAFLKACKEVGFSGYMAYEQCSAIILEGHKKASLGEVDRRAQAGLDYMKNLMNRLGAYSGKKASALNAAS
ncbi:MAG: sugar phosphate isomerase/epimerase family protein [Acidobacteriota bacterium]